MAFTSYAQKQVKEDLPIIGKMCPSFTLTDIHYYKKTVASLDDFKGKWLILDFWNKHCIACVKSFPKVNELQKAFFGKVQYVLVGEKDPENEIQPLYERLRKKFNLNLTIAYETRLIQKFALSGMPYIVIIDPNGIVRGITYELNQAAIEEFLKGGTPVLGKAQNKYERIEVLHSVDIKKPLLINGNGGDDTSFLFRSMLIKCDSNTMQMASLNFARIQNKFQTTRVDLRWLYKLAYGDTVDYTPNRLLVNFKNSYGKEWLWPVLEISDSSLFSPDWESGKNLYSYSLIVPSEKASSRIMQKMMQNDLKNYFGYEVSIELRQMPYWRLVVDSNAENSLKTKGGVSRDEGNFQTGFKMFNRPMSRLIQVLWAHNQSEPPFIDESNISYNIDLNVSADLNDLEEFSESLKKSGINLIKGMKTMRVIVIRDPHDN